MNRAVAVLAAVAAITVCSLVFADYSVTDEGTWPKTWPAELEPLRKNARTLVGPMALQRHYAIGFARREECESAWPHVLGVKSKGAPLFLVRGPNFFLGEDVKAGVVVHAPPVGRAGEPAVPEVPIAGVDNARSRWMNTTFVELVVDGAVVDLNRLRLPADTPIIDERFDDQRGK
jgi:hypothetical protein